MNHRTYPTARLIIALSLVLLSATGCAVVGALASKIPQYEAPPYKRLAGQSVGVMVWADRAVMIDWNEIQVDLAGQIQQQLRASDAAEVKGSTWPRFPASIVRYQKDHPGDELSDITDIAPKIGVSRLIYVELQGLSTRAAASLELFRGDANFTLKVVEVNGPVAVVGYEEQNIKASFPKHSTSDGVLNSSDQIIYRGTVKAIADQVVKRLITQEKVDDHGMNGIPE